MRLESSVRPRFAHELAHWHVPEAPHLPPIVVRRLQTPMLLEAATVRFGSTAAGGSDFICVCQHAFVVEISYCAACVSGLSGKRVRRDGLPGMTGHTEI